VLLAILLVAWATWGTAAAVAGRSRWRPRWTGPHPGWLTYETPHFLFYYAPGSILASDDRIVEFASQRERAWQYICSYLGIRDRRKIRFFVYDDNDVARRLIGRSAGFAQCTVAIIHARVTQTLGHEITHVLSRAITGRPPPNRVLDEGLAVWLDLSNRDKFEAASLVLLEGKLPSFAEMLEASKGEAEDWYVAAGAFVGYLCEAYGVERFKRIWASDSRRFSLDFKRVYGKTLQEMEAEWRAFLRAYLPGMAGIYWRIEDGKYIGPVVLYPDHSVRSARGKRLSCYNWRLTGSGLCIKWYSDRTVFTDGLRRGILKGRTLPKGKKVVLVRFQPPNTSTWKDVAGEYHWEEDGVRKGTVILYPDGTVRRHTGQKKPEYAWEVNDLGLEIRWASRTVLFPYRDPHGVYETYHRGRRIRLLPVRHKAATTAPKQVQSPQRPPGSQRQAGGAATELSK